MTKRSTVSRSMEPPRPRDNLDTIPKCFVIKIHMFGSYSYVEAGGLSPSEGEAHCACSTNM